MAFVPRIPQDLAYHDFADQRSIRQIPNFWNVVTNIPFILVGVWGIAVTAGPSNSLRETRTAYLAFFVGTVLVGLGSIYYHLRPANESLLWDRLAMTVSFAAFFTIVLSEYISIDFGRRILWPLLTCGVLSTVYWGYTESLGAGDLRSYAVIQFLPVFLIPIIVLMFRSRLPGDWYIWAVLGSFVIAKLAEALDGPIYQLLAISGHSIKHVVAAFGPLFMILALRLRRKISVGGDR
jgi:hypothetical protein